MAETRLTRIAKPHTSPEYERQAVEAARKRRLQMAPGSAPPTAPGEAPVSHYQGDADGVQLGPEPFRLSDHVPDPDER